MSKLSGLQSALNTSSGRNTAIAEEPEALAPRTATKAAKATKPSAATGRAGREYLAAWLPSDFKKSVRLIQAKRPDQSLQDLMAEAFNDLFSKYNVPTVSE